MIGSGGSTRGDAVAVNEEALDDRMNGSFIVIGAVAYDDESRWGVTLLYLSEHSNTRLSHSG